METRGERMLRIARSRFGNNMGDGWDSERNGPAISDNPVFARMQSEGDSSPSDSQLTEEEFGELVLAKLVPTAG